MRPYVRSHCYTRMHTLSHFTHTHTHTHTHSYFYKRLFPPGFVKKPAPEKMITDVLEKMAQPDYGKTFLSATSITEDFSTNRERAARPNEEKRLAEMHRKVRQCIDVRMIYVYVSINVYVSMNVYEFLCVCVIQQYEHDKAVKFRDALLEGERLKRKRDQDSSSEESSDRYECVCVCV
jgi:hypothetical protein